MIWFLGGALILLVLVLLGQWFITADTTKLAGVLRKVAALVLGLLALRFLVIGNIIAAGSMAGAALMALGLWQPGGRHFFARRPFGGTRPSRDAKSGVASTFFDMSLDHATGEMDGTVIKGTFSGQNLSDLDFDDLLALHRECATGDDDSRRLLEAYLERRYGERWSAHQQASEATDRGPAPAGDGPMTTDQAWAILGIEPGSSKSAIKAAHRRLMAALHPDHGGSDYLAARINQARDCLLRRG